MADYMTDRIRFGKEHLEKLIGWTIQGVLHDADQDDAQDFFDPIFTLLLTKGKQIRAAHILSDEEGNGAGHIDLSPIDHQATNAAHAKKICQWTIEAAHKPKEEATP